MNHIRNALGIPNDSVSAKTALVKINCLQLTNSKMDFYFTLLVT